MVSPYLVLLFWFPFFIYIETTTFNVVGQAGGNAKVGCIDDERQALLVFKQHLLDPSNRLSSWMEEEDCCAWEGVRCDNRTGSVVKLDLHNPYVVYDFDFASYWNDDTKTIGGEITHSLSDLQNLRYLDLSYNNFSSISIPGFFGSFHKLQYLNLSSSLFFGKIPNQLGNLSNLQYLDLHSNLSNLQYLDLSGNQFNGEIPHDLISGMTSLSHLSLSANQFKGPIPDSIGQLCNLKDLLLNENNLNGEIPVEFWSGCINNSLETLRLGYNSLSGVLPHDLGRFSSLQILSLAQNQFNGTLPQSLGQLSQLSRLDVSSNRFSGTLPQSVGQLSQLGHLDVSSNSLEGVISESHLFNLSTLYTMDLSFNSFTFNVSSTWVPPFQLSELRMNSCPVGLQFPAWIRTQKELFYLDISNSSIQDRIPNWFWNFSHGMYFVSFSSNHIYGGIPYIPTLSKGHIDLSSNYLSGSLPPISSNITSLNLANNSFSGPISNYLCQVVGPNNHLEYLDLSQNHLWGSIPKCLMYFKHLSFLNLGKNNFSGEIPRSICNDLENIQYLHLNENSFSGKLPLSLGNCTRLVTIDVGENKLSGNISKQIWGSLPNLVILRLHSNKFDENIPSQLCQLTSLQILDLSQNNLIGTIPQCLGDLSAMTSTYNASNSISYELNEFGEFEVSVKLVWKGGNYDFQNNLNLITSIDLSSNNLFGEIPGELMHLLGLRNLNLSHNHLTGKIPNTIGNMQVLECLDFSSNQLSGVIPMGLSNLTFLSFLNLSYNKLSGEIPRGHQLQTFDATRFMGNPKLCGPPLLVNCTNATSSQGPLLENKADEKDTEMTWFYIGLGMGYIIAFWGVCLTLIFKRSWRVAYFRCVNEVQDWVNAIIIVNARKMRRKLGCLSILG